MIRGDWGTFGVRGWRVPVRLAVAAAGALLWLGLMLVKTGSGGWTALWTALSFLTGLVALASLTRSVRLRVLVGFFFAGGFMMGVALLGSAVFEAFEPDPNATSREFVIPIMEEVLKLTPVLLWLWRRHWLTWTLGASDLLLAAAACGVGFGLVEDAFIRDRVGWPAQLPWLPLTEISGGRVIAGHAVWSAIAGIALGFGLLLRSRRRLAPVVALSGFAWSVLDHVSNNYSADHIDLLARILSIVVANGYLTVFLFVIGVVVAVAADVRIVTRTLPHMPELDPPALGLGFKTLRASWAFRLDKRALGYAAFRLLRAAEAVRPRPKRVMDALLRSLLMRHFAANPVKTEGGHPISST
jgi:RsiW-degrading membrane proteinase PrsW (M82 family)